MKRLVNLAFSALLLNACSDLSTDLKGDSVLDFGSGTNSILTCNAALEGKVVKPADSKDYRLCKDGQWFAIEIGDFDEADIYKPTAKSSSSNDENPDHSEMNHDGNPSSSSRNVIIIDEDDETIVIQKKSSSSTTTKPTSSATVAKPTSSSAKETSSSSKTIIIIDFDKPSSSASVTPKSSASVVPASSATVAPKSSANTIPESSSADMDPVEAPYICKDGKTIVVDMDNCPENQETESSSSSEEEVVDPKPESSAAVLPATKYDCSKYNCVTTEYLNQEMLAAGKYGELLDKRDNQVYRTIKIGEQVWMAQNLNYETEDSRCYNGSTENCTELGRLYYQSEAKDICPNGWHLPTNSEWNILNSYVDLNNGTEGVGNSLKSLTWTYGQAGTDLFGFSGLASHFFGDVIVCGSPTHGLYWTDDDNEYRCLLSDNSSLYHYNDIGSPTYGMSVRCLQNENSQTPSTGISSSSKNDISSSSESTTPKEFGVTTLLINTDIQPPVLGIYVDNYEEKDITKRGIVVGTSEEDLIANSKIETQESGYFDIFMSSTPQTGTTTHYFQNTTCKYEECTGVLRMLYGNKTYYVRSFVQLKDDSIIYGDVKSFETLDFTRSSSRIDYANVYSFSTSRFDCITDEQIPSGYTYISYTNEMPAAKPGSQSYPHYKVLTTWNHGIWNAGHSGKAVMTPTLHVENGELFIEPGDCSKANSTTCDAGNKIYYSVNGELFRGESFTELYEGPVSVKKGDVIQAFSQSSLGYHSALNFYVVTE